jgi:hypothetical protein
MPLPRVGRETARTVRIVCGAYFSTYWVRTIGGRLRTIAGVQTADCGRSVPGADDRRAVANHRQSALNTL